MVLEQLRSRLVADLKELLSKATNMAQDLAILLQEPDAKSCGIMVDCFHLNNVINNRFKCDIKL
jgi:hypothetical protein